MLNESNCSEAMSVDTDTDDDAGAGADQLQNIFLNHMCELQNAGESTDVVLVANDNKIKVPAHRVLLSTHSDYFNAMFLSAMRESVEMEIALSDVNGDDLKNLITYIYLDKIDIREDNADTLLVAADRLQLFQVVDACCDFIATKLNAENCCEFLLLAELYKFNNLVESAKSYAHANFLEICKSADFPKLDRNHINELLQRDDLGLNNEEEVMERLMAWFQYNRKEREKDILCLARKFVHSIHKENRCGLILCWSRY